MSDIVNGNWLQTIEGSLDNIEQFSKPVLGFQTSTLLTNAETYDSGILDMSTYTQVQTSILSDKNGTILY
jgi:hypothetical protein